MKFVTRTRGVVFAAIAVVGVHVILKLSEHSLRQDWFPSAVSVGLVVLACALVALASLYKARVKGNETLEIGRRGLLITEPGAVPFALAWRMIKTADLEQSVPQRWRFSLKNGGEISLNEGVFSREQWKKISDQLQRKFKARGIPVKVIQPQT